MKSIFLLLQLAVSSVQSWPDLTILVIKASQDYHEHQNWTKSRTLLNGLVEKQDHFPLINFERKMNNKPVEGVVIWTSAQLADMCSELVYETCHKTLEFLGTKNN